jgi:hypothetical protein
MTAHPVPSVIPGASRGHLRQGKSGAGRPMPLASPPGRPDVVYGFGRIGASGRVADRVTIAGLGWRGGDRLTVTAGMAPCAGGMVTRLSQRHFTPSHAIRWSFPGGEFRLYLIHTLRVIPPCSGIGL